MVICISARKGNKPQNFASDKNYELALHCKCKLYIQLSNITRARYTLNSIVKSGAFLNININPKDRKIVRLHVIVNNCMFEIEDDDIVTLKTFQTN